MVSWSQKTTKTSHSSQADVLYMSFPLLQTNCAHKRDAESASREDNAETLAFTVPPAPAFPDCALVNASSYITRRRHTGSSTP
ncbi:hypothetical protein ElyMa_003328900 [Elysia marginata]|uniref:Uncharacterized protein n=1 Tax=Elysia marginata TaxID=1093978 RepID=A0AAV4JE12_9GAST|nr:hypothetical protein ElyMa_003328900 [Elysia marginata]